MSLRDLLRETLETRAVKEGLRRSMLAIFEKAKANERGDYARVLSGDMHPAESSAVRSALVLHSELLQQAVERVMARIPEPRLLLPEDVVETIKQCLVVPDKDFEFAYTLFAASLNALLQDVESPAFPVAAATIMPAEDPNDVLDELDERRFTYRLSDLGCFRIIGAGVVPAELVNESRPLSGHLFYVRLAATESTQRAIDALASQIEMIMPSLLRSCSCLIPGKNRWFLTLMDADELPFLGFKGFTGAMNFELLKYWLNLALMASPREESVNRRISNAINLLAQADAQKHSAIGLSLCFSAMEALVCRKSEDIVAKLSENVAVLLEPKAEFRENAIGKVRELYGKRSDALHGKKLEEGREDRAMARQLAAALLAAVCERQMMMHRLGEDADDPVEFFKELRGALLRAQPPVHGLDDSQVVGFWRPK